MTLLTKWVGVLVVGGCLGFSNNAAAQCPPDETPGTMIDNNIQGTVVSLKTLPDGSNKVLLVVKLRNLTKYKAHILTVGNFNMSVSSGARLEKYEASGLNICQQEWNNDKENPQACSRKEGEDISSFTDFPSCGSVYGTLYFRGNNGIDVKPGEVVLNYMYKGLVRFSESESGPMVAETPAGPLHTVTLVFPPQPIR